MDIFEQAASTANFGRASAQKRGRNPSFPYVPVILVETGNRVRQRQLIGLAYATREEAVSRAQGMIDGNRQSLLDHLRDPHYRALREQYGLPRELEA